MTIYLVVKFLVPRTEVQGVCRDLAARMCFRTFRCVALPCGRCAAAENEADRVWIAAVFNVSQSTFFAWVRAFQSMRYFRTLTLPNQAVIDCVALELSIRPDRPSPQTNDTSPPSPQTEPTPAAQDSAQ